MPSNPDIRAASRPGRSPALPPSWRISEGYSHDAVLDADGKWRYLDANVLAVGPHAVLLEEALRPKVIGVEGERPEVVLISLDDIVENSNLNWALQAGERWTMPSVAGEPEQVYFATTWETWLEHASEPVSVWLPERDGEGIIRRLALVERELRFLREATEEVGGHRGFLVLLAAEIGLTRKEIGELIGLSTGRVQQLCDDAGPDDRQLVTTVLAESRELLALTGVDGPVDSPLDPRLRPPAWGPDKLDEVVATMVACGLLEETSEGLEVTTSGRLVVEVPDRRKRRARVTHG